MSKRLGWGRAAVVAALAMITAIPAIAQANWVNLYHRQGVVETRSAGTASWSRVPNQRRLGITDYARTGVNGQAQVRMSDGSVLAMGPKTTLQVKQFLMAAARETQVDVTSGSVRAEVGKFGGQSRFEVSTPNAVLAAQGTNFMVTVIDPNEQAMEDGWVQAQGGPPSVITQGAVFEGTVVVTSITGQTATLNPGDTLLVDQQGNLIVNPPAFPYTAALEQSQGLDTSPLGPLVPYEYSTVYEWFGSNETGLTADTRNVSTGTSDGNPPILINPQAETTGTLIIELHP